MIVAKLGFKYDIDGGGLRGSCGRLWMLTEMKEGTSEYVW